MLASRSNKPHRHAVAPARRRPRSSPHRPMPRADDSAPARCRLSSQNTYCGNCQPRQGALEQGSTWFISLNRCALANCWISGRPPATDGASDTLPRQNRKPRRRRSLSVGRDGSQSSPRSATRSATKVCRTGASNADAHSPQHCARSTRRQVKKRPDRHYKTSLTARGARNTRRSCSRGNAPGSTPYRSTCSHRKFCGLRTQRMPLKV